MDSFMNDVSSDERADHAGEENFFSLASSCLTIFKDVLGSDREPKIETYFQDCFDESTVYSNRNQDTSYAIEERFFHSMELLKSKMGNFFTSGEEIFSFANSSIYIFVDDMDSERETTIDEYYADCFDESPVYSDCNQDTSDDTEDQFYDSVSIQSNDHWSNSFSDVQVGAGVPLRERPDGEYNSSILFPEQTIILIDSITFE